MILAEKRPRDFFSSPLSLALGHCFDRSFIQRRLRPSNVFKSRRLLHSFYVLSHGDTLSFLGISQGSHLCSMFPDTGKVVTPGKVLAALNGVHVCVDPVLDKVFRQFSSDTVRSTKAPLVTEPIQAELSGTGISNLVNKMK